MDLDGKSFFIFSSVCNSAQGLHMSCSYADIAMAKCDSLANKCHLKPSVWERFRDDVFVLWEYGTTYLYLNTMEKNR